MAEYKFIGTEAMLRMDGKTVSLKRLGQTVDLTEEQHKLFSAKIPLLTQDQWHALAIPDDMVLRFPTPAVQNRAPKDFIDKLVKARVDAVGIKPVVEPAQAAIEAGDSHE